MAALSVAILPVPATQRHFPVKAPNYKNDFGLKIKSGKESGQNICDYRPVGKKTVDERQFGVDFQPITKNGFGAIRLERR